MIARSDDGLIIDFENIGLSDLPKVGGKNASLGELTSRLRSRGVSVPAGFATTAAAYWLFLEENGLEPQIERLLGDHGNGAAGATAEIRRLLETGRIPGPVKEAILQAYHEMGEAIGWTDCAVAVRSSATAEDLPHASFAGQQESFLNVHGPEPLLSAWKGCVASLFTDRAISYREQMGFDHLAVALSVGVQHMVRAGTGCAGVMFTLDPDSGFRGVTVINAAWGLGEYVVKGRVNPDSYVVFPALLDEKGAVPIISRKVAVKERMLQLGGTADSATREVKVPAEMQRRAVLNTEDILTLARWGDLIQNHYGRPMDIEWAKDGETGQVFVLQARPETVESRARGNVLETFELVDPPAPLCTGVAVGRAVVSGRARRLRSVTDAHLLAQGDILVADETDPDWGPVLPKLAAVVTDRGGRTSHAAIVSRELGIPAVVGTGDGTRRIQDGSTITVSCAEGDEGRIYQGAVDFERSVVDLAELPVPATPLMLNIGNPETAFLWWRLPVRGVGLARLEFIISEQIGVHPMALARFDAQSAEVQARVRERIGPDADPSESFVVRLTEGIAMIAALAHPHPALVRTSDFKTNEYARLVGGEALEATENNPMIGFRGASRYTSDKYREAFLLECEAIRRVRSDVGFRNVIPMIPFCRTLEEADAVLELMRGAGLERGTDGLEVYVMCEIPSNVVLAEEFAERFDGFSIGSNDLTQLALGVDRDSLDLADVFDEENPAVLRMIESVIHDAHQAGRPVGICGQGPSDKPGFARFLVEAGIDSISLSPDSVAFALTTIANAEQATAAPTSAGPREHDRRASLPA